MERANTIKRQSGLGMSVTQAETKGPNVQVSRQSDTEDVKTNKKGMASAFIKHRKSSVLL